MAVVAMMDCMGGEERVLELLYRQRAASEGACGNDQARSSERHDARMMRYHRCPISDERQGQGQCGLAHCGESRIRRARLPLRAY